MPFRNKDEINRTCLAPFVGQRLSFVGVVLSIEPLPRGKKRRQMVLASLRVPAEGLELDHLCIKLNSRTVCVREIKPMHVYSFTARINSYWHPVRQAFTENNRMHWIAAESRAYSVTDISWPKFRETPDALVDQPGLSLFLRNRIRQLADAEDDKDADFKAGRLETRLMALPNDGSREDLVNRIMTRKKTITDRTILNKILYS